MKPRQYSEFIDLFGYTTVELAPNLQPAIRTFKVAEIKKDPQTNGNVLHQTLKYVDWIAHHRAGGDYDRVEAFIVAPEFRRKFLDEFARSGRPQFRPPVRKPMSRPWEGLHLIRVDWSGGTTTLMDVTPVSQ